MAFFSKLLFLAFFSTLYSCVGVVEQKDLPITKGFEGTRNPVQFLGVHDAIAISDTAVEVYFFPANLRAEDITYIINFDGNTTPITIPGVNLRPDYRGLLSHTVRGLNINTTYNFSVQAKDQFENVSTSNERRSATTFSNVTANFVGVSNIRNVPGADGLTALLVEWPEAQRLGTDFSPKDGDVTSYIITLVDSDQLTPGDMNDQSFGEPARKVVVVPGTQTSRVVNGLQPGTTYHVQVRAVHDAFSEFGSIPTYKLEQNNYYLTATTLSSDSEGIIYDASVVSAARLNGSAGLNSVSVTWDRANGGFDHYRVYYNNTETTTFSTASHLNTTCDGPTTPGVNVPCKKLSFNASQTTISGLSPLTNYEVNVVICVDIDCSQRFLFERREAFTDPGIAIFGGITSVEGPKDASRLDRVFINISTPDVSSGNIDGLLVEIQPRTEDSIDEPVLLNHPLDSSLNTTDFEVLNFEFSTATSVEITGVNPLSAEEYCFKVFPFIYVDGAVEEQRGSFGERCVLISLDAPSQDQFTGVASSFFDDATNTFEAAWVPPTRGLFDQYIVYLRTDGGAFSFAQAVAGDSNYLRYEVSKDDDSWSVAFLPSGNYSVGILTYFSGIADANDPGKGYSGFNNNIATFTVP